MGCIVLSFLNLPPNLRNKPGYSLLYSIIPGPNAPNLTQISNSLRPLVDELLSLKDAVRICTSDYPKGREIYVQLLPSVGDLVEMHKIFSFGLHSASQFCAWCTAELKDLQAISIGTGQGAHEVREAANTRKSATSISLEEKIQKTSGVRWSELNRLPYCLPNMNVALGIMHNWLEGILQEHF
ncbi:hypothetical protein O181_010745 [Austropuccinia psidii MF-1]|uniref:Uncharacterized protein n=1 Tax=Austropuccinia psidii MF-1 TaxID=1389203 RepID=A0A9Q3BUI1_9BASI|nr:hypothetical protein [Austropuccinia psidii MF-1]